jgi:hypothetical protein
MCFNFLYNRINASPSEHSYETLISVEDEEFPGQFKVSRCKKEQILCKKKKKKNMQRK